jgi:methylglutaconyl-CoA hydratase
MADQNVRIERAPNGIATVVLDRPAARNAMNPELIGAVTEAFKTLSGDAAVRGIVVAGTGPVFCAGADLNWMRAVSGQTETEIAADARRLQEMYRAIAGSLKPTLARVHGAAFAGGLGIVAACDIVVAHVSTRFCLSEVRLGILPAIIAPFLLPKIGASWFRYLALTAATVDGQLARTMGLVHEVAANDAELDARVSAHIDLILGAAPSAVAHCKEMIDDLIAHPEQALLNDEMLRLNAHARASAEGQEGIAAFLERRKPGWLAAHR